MTQTMLVVGPVLQWQNARKELPQIDGITFLDFAALTSDYLDQAKPDFILSALVGGSFDALDLARLLSEWGYRGRYRAVAERLACPAVVLAEVAAVAPDLDFDVFQVARGMTG